jgi:GNAT superfamily N-acetyltransferase
MPSKGASAAVVRIAAPDDVAACGRICYDAFTGINKAHGFPPDFPNVEIATGLISSMFLDPAFYCIVAEMEGRIVGSNCLDERAIVRGIGPITIDPAAQNSGVGRLLMQAVMDRARDRGSAGQRLVQAAFHNRSLSLYTSFGFDIREPLSCLQGKTRERSIPGCHVRPAVPADEDVCKSLSRQVHGFDRAAELTEAVSGGTALVVERGDRVTGYTTHLGFLGHTTTETNLDMQALLASVESFAGPGVLVPSRNSVLLRWCLQNGLRVTQPMTLMSAGLYSDPAGAWLPSVTF